MSNENPPSLEIWTSWAEYSARHIDEHEHGYDLFRSNGGTIPLDTEVVYCKSANLVNHWFDQATVKMGYLLGCNSIGQNSYIRNRPELLEKYRELYVTAGREEALYRRAAELLEHARYIQEVDEVLLFLSDDTSHYIVWAGHSSDLIIRVDARRITLQNLRDIYLEWFKIEMPPNHVSLWKGPKLGSPLFTAIPVLPRTLRTITP